ncbi:MAG TPA: GNAT family N-acetyltransferase [Herpetosiphonaceae bacterium]|nr:GNAT family N-acetyltransferase [Herpetosiphonaceae bacterium]
MDTIMNTITMRAFAGEADLQPIVDLINACEAVDKLDEGTSVAEMRSELYAPRVDLERDIRLCEDAEGRVIGFGTLWIPEPSDTIDGFLWLKVHPEARGAGIESRIIGWGEERMREVGRETGKPVQMRSGSMTPERAALLERHGYEVARYFHRMVRPLDVPIPEPRFPEGFTLRHLESEDEAEAWVACFNQSFIDHYNHHPMSVNDRKHWMHEEHYAPALDLVATAPDGTFAAFCWCSMNPDDNARTGRNEGWIGILGTRRGFRRIGLGRAMLLSGLHRLKANGVDTAKLGVDADSLTGATRLYESVGFRVFRTSVSYKKDL